MLPHQCDHTTRCHCITVATSLLPHHPLSHACKQLAASYMPFSVCVKLTDAVSCETGLCSFRDREEYVHACWLPLQCSEHMPTGRWWSLPPLILTCWESFTRRSTLQASSTSGLLVGMSSATRQQLATVVFVLCLPCHQEIRALVGSNIMEEGKRRGSGALGVWAQHT